MSFQTIQQLKAAITPKLHGTTLAKVGNLYPQIAEAVATMLLRVDPPDTIQKSRIDNAIYNKIYNYTCPTDFKGVDRMVDIRPIGRRDRWDETTGSSIAELDRKKLRNSAAIETIAGVKTLRIVKNVSQYSGAGGRMVTLSYLNNTDSTITSGGDVTSPVVDDLDYIDFSSSISFGLSGATGIGTITVNLPNTVDLSKLLNLGSLFHWLKFPDATRFTSVDLKWGSSSSAYWHKTVTVPQGRTAVDSNAWDLMRFDWTSATMVSTPDSTAVNYFQITINYTTGAALTFCKVNSLTASLGVAYELVYYSNAPFKDSSSGALKQIPTAESDIIQMDPAALNILMYEVLRVLAQQLKGRNMGADIGQYNYILEGDGRVIRSMLVMNRTGLYRDYISQNPSQAIPPQQVYHEFDGLSGFGIDNDRYDDQ